MAGVNCRLRRVRCYKLSFSPAISSWSSNRRTNVSVSQCVLFGCVCVCACILHIAFILAALSLTKETVVSLCVCVSGCLLTIILLMRALDPLGHEKETLAHFQTLKVRSS